MFLPWLIIYEAFVVAGPPRPSVSSYFPFENHWPVLLWMVPVYVGAYPFTIAAPFFAASLRDLRRFALAGFTSMAAVFSLFLTVPLVAAQRPFRPSGVLGLLLALDDRLDGPNASFPSYHVVWAFIAAEVYASRFPRAAWVWRLCPLLIAASCIGTGKHSLVDVVAAILLAVLQAAMLRARRF